MSHVIAVNDFRNSTTSVRVWEPGDGLYCAHRSRASAPCGRPVAVMTTHEETSNCRRPRTAMETRSYVLCLNHLAKAVQNKVGGMNAGNSQEQKARSAALERLAVAHWEEFQRYQEEARVAAIESMLDVLPDGLREAVQNLDALQEQS